MPTAENVELLVEMADQIRAALDDVTDIAVQVEPLMVLNPTPPCIDMWPGDIARDQPTAAFNDDGGFNFTIRARVSTADSVAGQALLLAFMDDINALSVGQALYDDPTLNGLASDLSIVAQTGYELAPDLGGDGALLSCRWQILVLRADS